jgi:hypothetical protein
VTDVFNLDEVDFFYTVSAPLTQQVWDPQDTLERLVRLVRQTRPDVLLTMKRTRARWSRATPCSAPGPRRASSRRSPSACRSPGSRLAPAAG